MESTGVKWGSIQGREITFPMEVASFNALTMGFTVPIDAARELLPGEAFEVAETAPGSAQMIFNVCDYRENPWGDYNEFNLGFLVQPVNAGPEAMGSFVYRMPVDQEFTAEAGRKVMGFPKSVYEIPSTYTDEWVEYALVDEPGEAVRVRFPRVSPFHDSSTVESMSYSYLDGVAYATPLTIEMPADMLDPASIDITLGTGPIAEELASLGLPGTPDFATYGERLSATFQLGSPVSA